MQAIVTPAPDAEPPPGGGQNTGISGTTHTVAYSSGDPGRDDPAGGRPRVGRRLRPIRYAHSATDQTDAPTVPVETVAEPPPPAAPTASDTPTSGTGTSGTGTWGTERPGTVLSGTVVAGLAPDDGPEDDDDTAGLVYGASRPDHTDPDGSVPPGEPAEPVSNEGLGIFGDVATTEVTDDDTPTRDFQRPSRWEQPAEPPPSPAEPPPTHVIPIGAAWNQPIASRTVASDEEEEERKPHPFGRMREFISGGGQPPDDETPRVSIRDLPPDVQLRFWRLRATIMVVVGVLFAILTRSWEVALTLAILAGIIDTIYRSRNAAHYVNGPHPGARRATSKQLAKMRREGYFVLNDRPIPNSGEVIDHLVVGPTGVYAIDSEKWNPKLPIRTWNGKKLYHGPESQKDRLEHAAWEASQASEILSGALGTEISVRPALAIYGPKIPWDIATIRNVDVFTGSALRKYLKRRSRMKEGVARLTREEVRTIYETASRMLPDVTQTYTPVG
ncbi:MAG TPA: nuclease-related domain-containing protein [Trebonia sp.]